MTRLMPIIAFSVALVACSKSEPPASPPVPRVVVKATDDLVTIKAAADKGDPEAQWLYSVELRTGKRGKINMKEAYAYREKAANAGHAVAMVGLASMLDVGDGVPVDPDRASKLREEAVPKLEQLSAANDPAAMFYLGDVIGKGTKSIPKDEARSKALWTKAADAGYSFAKDALANALANEHVKNGAYDMAIEVLVPAFDAGSERIAARIARVFWLKKDSEKEKEWLIKGWDKGCAKCALHLAEYYAGLNDATQAIEWAKKAAEKGLPEAQYELGREYINGQAVKVHDERQGIALIQLAADQLYVPAMNELANQYLKGTIIPKDEVKAFGLRKAAAISGYPYAMVSLAFAYGEGIGVEVDNVLAYAWANLAVPSKEATALATKIRDVSEGRLSKAERVEAQELASGWKRGRDITRKTPSATDQKAPAKEGAAAPSVSMTKVRTGTGFFVSGKSHMLSVAHVIDEGCKEIKVAGNSAKVSLVTTDKANDLALLKVESDSANFAPITSDPGKVRQGEDVVVYGYPLNSVLSSGGNLTPGVISALTGLGNNSNQIQITAPIQPGSSGSPVLDKKGRVVGMVTMKLSDSKMATATGQIGQNVNFAVSGQTVKTFLDANKVEYKSSGMFSFEKSTADLADEARKWTSVVECWK